MFIRPNTTYRVNSALDKQHPSQDILNGRNPIDPIMDLDTTDIEEINKYIDNFLQHHLASNTTNDNKGSSDSNSIVEVIGKSDKKENGVFSLGLDFIEQRHMSGTGYVSGTTILKIIEKNSISFFCTISTLTGLSVDDKACLGLTGHIHIKFYRPISDEKPTVLASIITPNYIKGSELNFTVLLVDFYNQKLYTVANVSFFFIDKVTKKLIKIPKQLDEIMASYHTDIGNYVARILKKNEGVINKLSKTTMPSML